MIQLSVPRKALLGFAAALFILAVIGTESIRGLRAARDASALVRQSYGALQTLGDVRADVLDAEAAMRGQLLTRNPKFRTLFDAAAHRVAVDVTSLANIEPDDPAQSQDALALAAAVARKMAMMRQALAAYDLGRTTEARRIVADGAGIVLTQSVRVRVSGMMRAEQDLLNDRLEQERAQQRVAAAVVLFGFLVAVVVAALAVITIDRDVRERERLDAELQSAFEEARAASSAKSEFLARMSHELRTPLNSVIGFANVVLKAPPERLDDQARSYVQRIKANGTHLLEIINDILDLSKVESGRMDLVLETVDPAQLLRETMSQFAARGVEAPPIDVEIPPDVAPLRTDPDKLRQVLLNLVSNAAKFTPQGRVVVRGIVEPGTRDLQRVDVIDNGVGIPPDRLAKIFEAFEQADSSIQRKFGGTGLGLAIARSMCERMGYELTVVSELNVGSTFSIALSGAAPRLTQHQAPGARPGGARVRPTPSAVPAVADASGPVVLVIDDSEDSRLLLSQIIEESGYRVVTAASGEAGISAALDHRPAAIVLDLLMPQMDGFETLQRVKAHPSIAAIPVIVVSVVASEYRTRLAGAVELLDKPISREVLGAAIDRALHATPIRALVVEASEDTMRILDAHLSTFPGIATEHARSAAEARTRLAASPMDLILLDLPLPDADGAEFLRQLRGDERYHDIPIILLTAQSLTPDESRAFGRETLAVLGKSAALSADLARVLRGALRTIRAHPRV